MDICEIKKEEIPKRKFRKHSEYRKIVQEFIDSGFDAVEVKDYPATDPKRARAALSYQINRLNAPVIIAVRSNRVFLIRGE